MRIAIEASRRSHHRVESGAFLTLTKEQSMKSTKQLLTAIALAAAAVTASAADYELTTNLNLVNTKNFGNAFNGTEYYGKTFLDTYNFEFLSQSDLDAVVTSIATRNIFDLNITSFDLYNSAGLVLNGSQENSGGLDLWLLSGLALDGGKYSLKVGGSILGTAGGSYGGNINVSPVPEPETYAMLGIGLAVIGYAGRRRKARPPAGQAPA